MTARELLGIALATLAIASTTGAQPNPDALMREGNAMFRSQLYRTALVRYREAHAMGIDSSIYHYNIGITHYRLGQYDDAIVELERAYADDSLAALAAYNLGLSQNAAGRATEAQRWFELARTRARGSSLELLAENALTALSKRNGPTAIEVEPRQYTVDTGDDVGEFRLQLRVGFGTDDNPNRAPSEAYIDVSQPSEPLVEPEAIESAYVPVDMVAEYILHNESGDTDFVFGYELDGNYYDEFYANDESTQRLRIGTNIDFDAKEGRSRSLRSSIMAIQHHQRDFDPDTGIDRYLNDFELYRRYIYTAIAIEMDFAQQLGRWSWGFDMRAERREHDQVPIVENYDNEIYALKTSVGYAINYATDLRFGARSYRRTFDSRPSLDIDGVLLSTNLPIEYAYEGVEIGVRRRFGSSFEVDFAYLTLDRTDTYDDYNDYTQDMATFRATYRPSRKFSVAVGAAARTYDYANAFAFNDPASGLKELEDRTADLTMVYEFTDHLAISADVLITDVESNDSRAAYSRSASSLGLVWRL